MEVFKSHKDYPHIEFSNMGNARKLGKNGEYKLCKPTNSKKQRYLQVNAKPGVKLYLHREICKLFNLNPNPAEYTHVLHNNNNHLDNRAENLRFGNQKLNMQDRLEAGHYNRGFGHNMAKLSNKDVFEIKWLWENKIFNQTQIANCFDIKPCTISFITTGKTWKHLLREDRIKE